MNSRLRSMLFTVGVVVLGGTGTGCASLNTGWAKVTWADGSVSPVVACTTRIDAEGDVAMECVPLNKLETDLLWKRERQRTGSEEL